MSELVRMKVVGCGGLVGLSALLLEDVCRHFYSEHQSTTVFTNLCRTIDDELPRSTLLAADSESHGQLTGKLNLSGLLILPKRIRLRFEFLYGRHVEFIRPTVYSNQLS